MKAWLPTHPIILCFPFGLKHFPSTMHTKLGLPHSLALGLSHCICGQPLNPMGFHFFPCTHGGERTTSHDVMKDAFASIARDASLHVSYEQTHVLLPPTFQSSHWPVNIVFFSWWHSHISQCHHCWPHSSGLGFACSIISQGGQDSDGSNKGKIVLKSMLCKLVSSSCH
jgi:hypothetical protein